MMIKKSVLTVIFLSFTFFSFSQNDDFGIWYNVSAEHNLVRKLEFDLSASVRTFNKASSISEAFFEAGLTFKINKFFAVAGSYRLTDTRDKDDTYHMRHKWFTDLKGTLPIGDLTLSTRLRFEERYKTYFLDENDKIPTSHGRYKFKALYNIPSFPVNPYIAAEIFSPMFTNIKRHIDKNRFSAGVEYNIAKKHSLDVEYMFQRDYLPHISDINVVSVSYNLKF